MALSTQTLVGTSATVGSAGTAVTPTIAPPDNCHTIIIYNPSTTGTIYVAFTDAASIPVGEAVFVPSNGSLTLAIGAKSARPPSGVFKVDASDDGLVARIAYVNGTSS